MRSINLIVVHHSASPPSVDLTAQQIDRMHRLERGWLRIGYHFVIRRNGTVENGRPLSMVGAHATGFNANSIGICLVGGIDSRGQPEHNYTSVQMEALRKLVGSLRTQFPTVRVCGHSDVNPKSKPHCPMFDVKVWAAQEGFLAYEP
jgi:N-acetyl-anhydromuramyl-L-alanine amidase AmpD